MQANARTLTGRNEIPGKTWDGEMDFSQCRIELNPFHHLILYSNCRYSNRGLSRYYFLNPFPDTTFAAASAPLPKTSIGEMLPPFADAEYDRENHIHKENFRFAILPNHPHIIAHILRNGGKTYFCRSCCSSCRRSPSSSSCSSLHWVKQAASSSNIQIPNRYQSHCESPATPHKAASRQSYR
jgi:hypothetical protein